MSGKVLRIHDFETYFITITRKKLRYHFDLEKKLMTELFLDPSHVGSPWYLSSCWDLPRIPSRTFPFSASSRRMRCQSPLPGLGSHGNLRNLLHCVLQRFLTNSSKHITDISKTIAWTLNMMTFKEQSSLLQGSICFLAANRSFSWGVSDLLQFTCHLFSLCPEEKQQKNNKKTTPQLSWSHRAIKFASSWGDKFSARWQGTLRWQLPSPLSPIVSSARPWTSSKSCVRAVSVILRRQRFLLYKLRCRCLSKFCRKNLPSHLFWQSQLVFAQKKWSSLNKRRNAPLQTVLFWNQKMTNSSTSSKFIKQLHQMWFFWTFP